MNKVATKTQERLPKSGPGFRASVLHASDGAELVIGQCRDFAFPKHTHQEYTIGLVMSGQEQLFCDGSYHPATRGSIYFSHPDQVHGGEAIDDGEWTYASLYLTPEALKEQFEGEVPGFDTAPVNDLESTTLYSDLIETLTMSECRVETQSALISFTKEIIKRHSRPTERRTEHKPDVPAIKRAKELMHAGFHEPLTLKDIARVARLHPGYLIESFKSETGITPHAYLLSIRLNAARQALAAGSSPADTATDCGFYDQSHLGRHFARIYGISPARFQKQIGN